jgi:predicted phage-related endonuclease
MKPEQDPNVRQGKYGGSIIAAIRDMHRYSHKSKAYQEFRGEVEEEDLTDNPYVWSGVHLENTVGKMFTDKMGLKIRMISKTMVAKDWDLAQAHIDAKIQGQNVGLELKTASEFKKKEYSEHLCPNPMIPVEYRCQINHYLYVSGWDYWWLAVLIGGNDFRVFKIERDEKAIQEQIDEVKAFHENHIVPGIMPIARTPDEALYQFPFADTEEESIVATPLIKHCIAEGKKILQEEKELKLRKDENKKNIQNIMKSASVVVDPGDNKDLITWKNGSRSGLDTKALQKEMPELWHEDRFGTTSTYRTFKIL